MYCVFHPIASLTLSILSVLLAMSPVFAKTSLSTTYFTTLQGKSIAINHWHGKVIVVNFWASWCAPCREELPMFNALRDSLASKGVEVVGIALENKAEAKDYIKKWNIRYPILLGSSDTLDLLRELGNSTQGLPFTVVLNREGKIVARLVGKLSEKTLQDTLRRYL